MEAKCKAAERKLVRAPRFPPQYCSALGEWPHTKVERVHTVIVRPSLSRTLVNRRLRGTWVARPANVWLSSVLKIMSGSRFPKSFEKSLDQEPGAKSPEAPRMDPRRGCEIIQGSRMRAPIGQLLGHVDWFGLTSSKRNHNHQQSSTNCRRIHAVSLQRKRREKKRKEIHAPAVQFHICSTPLDRS